MSLNGNGSETAGIRIGSDEWMQKEVEKCVDGANGVLTLSNKGLTSLSTRISDLRNLVTLPASYSPNPSTSVSSPNQQFRPMHSSSPALLSPHLNQSPLSANSRSFSRTISAPASSGFFNNLAPQPSSLSRGGDVGLLASPTLTERTETSETNLMPSPSLVLPSSTRNTSFGRSKTGAHVGLGSPGNGGKSVRDISVYAGSNLLTSVPSALFEISYLTVLSLRSNQLTALPAAIGELQHLKELNISNNQITVLPSTILSLSLTQFSAHPNPFITPPAAEITPPTPASISATASPHLLSPLVYHYSSSVPKLSTICLNYLLSPRPPSNLPPLLDSYNWEPTIKGETHPLLDPAALRSIIPSLTESDLRRVLQALKTASFEFSRSRKDAKRPSVALNPNTTFDPFPRTHRPPPPDDASLNPYHYPCPSPRHFEYSSSADLTIKPSKYIFLHPAEERTEWREVFGIAQLPIQWQGCSTGCLGFLEKNEDEDEWGLEEEDEEEGGE
ncbi:hypothetical protein P7C73_g4666, partial [Tremellales sp. Uapishka_1]